MSLIYRSMILAGATSQPNVPTLLTASPTSPSQIDLAWTDNADNETGFKIERDVNGGGFSQIDTVGAGVTTYSDTGLSTGSTYTYRVRAYNGAGNSAYSNQYPVTLSGIQDGGKAYWRIKENGGPYADSIGSNNLAENGTMGQNDPGRIGNVTRHLIQVGDFDPANSAFLSIADNADLSTGDVDFYVAAWVYPEFLDNSRVLISKWDSTGGDREYILQYFLTNDVWRFGVSNDGSATTFVESSTFGSPSTGIYYFIEAWHDSVNNEIGICINRGTDDTAAHTTGVNDGASDFIIGANDEGRSLRWNGRIGPVLFRKGSIPSTAERDELYNRGMGLDYPLNAVLVDDIDTVANDGRVAEFENQQPYRKEALTQVNLSGTVYEAITYWNNNGNLVIGKREQGGAWTLYTMDGTGGRPTISLSGAADNHDTAVIGLDPNGFIHVAYDHHVDALNYRTSDAAIDTWTGGMTAEKSMLGTNEAGVTYPTFFNDPIGTLYFMFRDGSAGNGDLFFYEYDESGTSWSAATGTGTGGKLIDGKTDSFSPYWSQPPAFDDDFGSGGYMHLAWVWRDGSGDNHDVAYVKWDGTSWEQADGTSQTVPIREGNDDAAVTIATTENLSAWPSIDADSSGNPHITYREDDASNLVQFYHVWHNGTSWQTPTVVTSNTEFDTSWVTGFLPQIAVRRSDDAVFILYFGMGDGMGIHYQMSTDYSTWSGGDILAVQTGAWHVNYNRQRWVADTTLQFAILPLPPQFPSVISITAAPIRIYEVGLATQ